MFSFYIVDDDPQMVALESALIEQAGHRVWSTTSSNTALHEIPTKRPDCIIVDLMMPELDGLELCTRLRRLASLERAKIVFVTAKSYEFDRRRARQAGADGYLIKPIDPDTFIDQVERIIAGRPELSFWGVRGTLPVPGRHSVRYGGNTPCVSLALDHDRLFIFDAGSGIKALSDHIMSAASPRTTAKILISHPHWDHINALPFFAPFYVTGNEFEICGPSHGDLRMRQMVSAQMDGVYFPISIREFGAHVMFRDVQEGSLDIDGVQVQTMLLNHPGNCLGYRIEHSGAVICYVTDNELFPPELPQHDERYVEHLISFVKNADVLITDATYTDEEYASRVGWGHSAVGAVAELADRADVRSLFLFHHDPDQNDDDIDAKLERAQKLLSSRGSATRCFAPSEGETVTL